MLRVIDSGLRTARQNLSVTEALAEGLRGGKAPATLRFQHFPPSAIIGRHQRLAREVDLAWVSQNKVATARRMTGGGAIIMGPGILGWELVTPRGALPANLAEISKLLCEAVAKALSSFGVTAAFRPRNDVEVAGRKICGTGGYFDQSALIFQGTVLVALDRDLMSNALRLPAHKLSRHGIAALFERVTDLASLLPTPPDMVAIEAAMAAQMAEALNLARQPATLSLAEESRAAAIHATMIGTDAFVEGREDTFAPEGRMVTGEHATPFGTIEAVIKLRDGAAGVVDQVMIAGDFFAASPRVILDLEAHLRQTPLAMIGESAATYLAGHDAGLMGIAADDIVAALVKAATGGAA